MSSPTTNLSSIFGNLLNTLVNAFNTLVEVVSDNLPTLIEIGLAAAVIGAAVYAIKRYAGEIAGFFRGFIRF